MMAMRMRCLMMGRVGALVLIEERKGFPKHMIGQGLRRRSIGIGEGGMRMSVRAC